MTKTIDTLVEDLQELLKDGLEGIPQETIEAFGARMGSTLASRLITEEKEESEPTLRMSSIGQPCTRKLWYEINKHEEKEELSADTRLKFLYGDLLEEFVLFLAELTGHTVEGRQDTLAIAGIKGHRDAIIDGVVVDVKSASSFSFNKFKKHELANNDPFGYITQLQSYLHASQGDPRVVDKSRGAFLVVDKTLGHICLDFHNYIKYDWESYYERRKELVSKPEVPGRGFTPIPDGKSGNLKLPVNCSYCPFKHTCHPGLRTFIYSTGPVYLTKVAREPLVPEVTK